MIHNLTRYLIRFSAIVALLSFWAAPAQAQFQMLAPSKRYELGKRVREVELLWDNTTDPELRKLAAKEMESAVRQFFSLRLAGACRCLDRTYLALSTEEAGENYNKTDQWLRSLSIRLENNLLPGNAESVKIKLQSLYAVKNPQIDAGKIEAHVAYYRAGKYKIQRPRYDSTTKGRYKSLAQLQELFNVLEPVILEPGDFDMLIELKRADQDKPAVRRWFRFSVVKDYQSRVASLNKWLAETPYKDSESPFDESAYDTVKEGLRALDRAFKGEAREYHERYNDFLRRLEDISEDKRMQRPGIMALHFGATGRLCSMARIYIPSTATKDSPLIIGMHGMGGSENMFFQTYGHGKILKACHENGWILVCPRIGLLASKLNIRILKAQLSPYIGESDRPVCLVGHSMGASTIVQGLAKNADSVKAVALISGGGRFKDPMVVKNVPVYLSAGDQDFGAQITEITRGQITGVVDKVIYEEHKNTEHLFVVTESIPSIVKLFKECVAKKRARLY